MPVQMTPGRPVLLYANDCGICTRFVDVASSLSKGWADTVGLFTERGARIKSEFFRPNDRLKEMIWLLFGETGNEARSGLLPLARDVIRGRLLRSSITQVSVDDPEPRLIYRFVDVEESLVLQNAQRDKAEGRDGEVCPVSNLFSQPVLHLIDQSDGLDRVVSSLSRQPDNERIGWEPIVLVEDSGAVVDDFLPFV